MCMEFICEKQQQFFFLVICSFLNWDIVYYTLYIKWWLIVHVSWNRLLIEPSMYFILPCRYVTDVLQMCMKKLYAKTIYEKKTKNKQTKKKHLELSQFWTTVFINGGMIVHTLWNQLQQLSMYLSMLQVYWILTWRLLVLNK